MGDQTQAQGAQTNFAVLFGFWGWGSSCFTMVPHQTSPVYQYTSITAGPQQDTIDRRTMS